MEPILLYGFPAGSSMGLVAAFERLGKPYRLCRVDMMADMKNDAYASLNGRQETPVLVTGDGRTLTETMAIAAWMEARDAERRISFEPLTGEDLRRSFTHVFWDEATGRMVPLPEEVQAAA